MDKIFDATTLANLEGEVEFAATLEGKVALDDTRVISQS